MRHLHALLASLLLFVCVNYYVSTLPISSLTAQIQVEHLFSNNSCTIQGGCGLAVVSGWMCAPSQPFAGQFVCYDSSMTLCGFGHQLAAIAVLKTVFGHRFRIVYPLVSHHQHINMASYASVFKQDGLIVQRKHKYEQCARLDNGYDQSVYADKYLHSPGFIPRILVPFLNEYFLDDECPVMVYGTSKEDVVAVKIRISDIHLDQRRERNLTLNDYCKILELPEFRGKKCIYMTDGPLLKCENVRCMNIEEYQAAIQKNLNKPLYRNELQRFVCNLKDIVSYSFLVTNHYSTISSLMKAFMVRKKFIPRVYDVFRMRYIDIQNEIRVDDEQLSNWLKEDVSKFGEH